MRCRFIRKIFQNEENGYTIAVFSTQDTSVPLSARDKFWSAKKVIAFTAIGYDLPLSDEIEVEMEGNWESSTHGLQYKVESFLEVVPRTREGILGYLSCGSVKGVGPKMAERIVDQFGLNTLEIMEKTPEKLLKVRGISKKKLDGIMESFGKNQVFRELMTFLAPFHVTPKKVNMILKQYQDRSMEIIRKQPYALFHVKGFGFLTVDAIARQCGASPNDPMRISGCISYVLNEEMRQNGHLYLKQDALIKSVLNLLNEDQTLDQITESEINGVLYRLAVQHSIVVDDDRIYRVTQYEEERRTAMMIAKRLMKQIPAESIEKELEEAQKVLGITLSDCQKEAVRMVFRSPISIITGGPGTGKTTVLKVILYIHKEKYKTEVQLMAPTGRAARRMAESTGHEESSTMHMALGLYGDDEYEPMLEELSAEFVNVDEFSMVDMHLAYEFFSKVKPSARVLLVGDIHQLPSVGAGEVFRQLILCGKIPVTTLDLVYRQGKNSNIALNAKLMQQGRTDLIEGEDFQMIACKGAEEAAQIVKELYVKELAVHGMDQVQILSPYKVRSAAGVIEINRTIQDVVNPPISGKKELHIHDHIFREGDKVLQNKNTEVASNGDMGILTEISEDKDGNPLARIVFTMYLKLIGLSFKVENTSILLAFVIGLLIILSNVTYASISIEGKQRELLKSYPVSIKELLLAKYLFHLSLTVPMIFICATLLGIVCRMNISEYCLLFFLPTVFSVFAGALGLLINLVFPNYEWENITYIVKQSISAIITILLSVLIVGGSLWIVLYFFHTHILFASYILAFLFALLTMLIGILLKKASKTF